jgi:hypothetical protein
MQNQLKQTMMSHHEPNKYKKDNQGINGAILVTFCLLVANLFLFFFCLGGKFHAFKVVLFYTRKVVHFVFYFLYFLKVGIF